MALNFIGNLRVNIGVKNMRVWDSAASFDKCIHYAYIREVNTSSAQTLPKHRSTVWTNWCFGRFGDWSLELPYIPRAKVVAGVS